MLRAGTCRARALLLLAGLLALPVLGLSRPARARSVAPAEEARILSTIRLRVQRFMARASGIAARRRTVTREYDLDDNRLLRTIEHEADQIDYFHDRPAIATLSCAVDGRRVGREACESDWQRPEPHLQLFDRAGERNYAIRVSEELTLRGQRAYRVTVRARQRTARHFVGQLVFRASDLQLLWLEGSVARLPFPLRHLYFKLHFVRRGADLVGVSRGYVDVGIRVPLLLGRRIVSRFTADGHRAVRW